MLSLFGYFKYLETDAKMLSLSLKHLVYFIKNILLKNILLTNFLLFLELAFMSGTSSRQLLKLGGIALKSCLNLMLIFL